MGRGLRSSPLLPGQPRRLPGKAGPGEPGVPGAPTPAGRPRGRWARRSAAVPSRAVPSQAVPCRAVPVGSGRAHRRLLVTFISSGPGVAPLPQPPGPGELRAPPPSCKTENPRIFPHPSRSSSGNGRRLGGAPEQPGSGAPRRGGSPPARPCPGLGAGSRASREKITGAALPIPAPPAVKLKPGRATV